MLSRGYNGSIPSLGEAPALRRDWAVAATLPVLAACIATIAWMMTW